MNMDAIFHIDEPAKWPMVINNVNHYHEWLAAQNVPATVEVLVNGAAVTATAIGSNVDMTALTRVGATVAVCMNSLAQRHIDVTQLQPGIITVPVGVIELAEKQHAGFAYIHP